MKKPTPKAPQTKGQGKGPSEPKKPKKTQFLAGLRHKKIVMAIAAGHTVGEAAEIADLGIRRVRTLIQDPKIRKKIKKAEAKILPREKMERSWKLKLDNMLRADMRLNSWLKEEKDGKKQFFAISQIYKSGQVGIPKAAESQESSPQLDKWILDAARIDKPQKPVED